MSDPHSSDLAARDPWVSRALATLPVPEHAPEFWLRLDAALDAEPPLDADPALDDRAVAAPPLPPPVLVGRPAAELAGVQHIPLDDRPADELGARRRHVASRAVRPLLAAASVVLVIGLVRLGLDDGRDPAPAAQQQSTSGAVAPVPTTGGPGTVPTSSTVGSAPPAGAEEAGQVLAAFLDALGNGRVDDAARLVGPRSEAYLTAQSGSVRAFLTEATEGFGAWASSTDRTIRAVPVAAGSLVLVVEGTVQQEGSTAHRTDAFPMTKAESANAWFVDMWAFDPAIGGRLELSQNPDPTTHVLATAVGRPLELFVPAAGSVRFSLDGRPPVDVATVRRSASNVATWTPTAADATAADAGPRVLVVSFVSGSGTIFAALAIQVQVG
jgi:hypothetical protein